MEDAKHLEKLLAYKDDEQVLKTLREIKMHSKQELADYLKRTQHVEDVYKRQGYMIMEIDHNGKAHFEQCFV